MDKAKLLKVVAAAAVTCATAVGVSHSVPTPPPAACIQIQQLS